MFESSEIDGEYKFVVTIPAFGKPDINSVDLLARLQRHVELSISSRATVEAHHSWYDDVMEFHEVFDCPVGSRPDFLDERLHDERWDFYAEEVDELDKAYENKDLPELADAFADMIYFLIGTAICHGIPLDRVWDEVQRSNMAKRQPDGSVKRNRQRKVMKPKGWTAPDIKSIIDEALKNADSTDR